MLIVLLTKGNQLVGFKFLNFFVPFYNNYKVTRPAKSGN